MKLAWWRRDELGCREVGRVLQSYLDGELDQLLAHRVVRHLDMCRRCGMAAETYTEIKHALQRSAGSPPPGTIARLRAFGEQLTTGWVPPHEEETGA
jgi:anti-sigma factor RsiW